MMARSPRPGPDPLGLRDQVLTHSQCMAGTLGLMVYGGLTVYGILAGTLGTGSHDWVWLEHH
jgi:hypothetical protein